MRFFSFFLASACLFPASSVSAQDIFAGIPVEPRPSDYIHWNAEEFEGFKSELQRSLREGNGIWDTDFVYLNALPQAVHRPHNIQIIHRSGYTQPEIHELKWDIYVILDGSGVARIGGGRVGWVDGLPPEQQHPQLEGFKEYQVGVGDIIHVPAREWHQMLTEPNESITYALINVFE